MVATLPFMGSFLNVLCHFTYIDILVMCLKICLFLNLIGKKAQKLYFPEKKNDELHSIKHKISLSFLCFRHTLNTYIFTYIVYETCN